MRLRRLGDRGGGIGRTIAQGLAEAGGKIVVLDRDSQTGVETAQIIRCKDIEAIAVACDINPMPCIAEACRPSRDALSGFVTERKW
jgi:NAD(P)-dependent dehydrogenase (short-subunit alcohol dehydrogenase family)